MRLQTRREEGQGTGEGQSAIGEALGGLMAEKIEQECTSCDWPFWRQS